MFVVAQTNIQLFNQLRRQGRGPTELQLVRTAYHLAMHLFSGQYRGNGKPFVVHLVGTASVLAWFEQSATVVAAGLLHSAFEFGDFGDGQSGITATRQNRMATAVGRESTALIAHYYRLQRRTAKELMRRGDLAAFAPAEIAVLVMHLADTVEEYADGGIQYAAGKEKFLRQSDPVEVTVDALHAAPRLGLAAFVPGMAEIFQASVRWTPPPELVESGGKSFRLIPSSLVERPSVRCRRYWRKLRHNLAKFRQ